MNNKIIGGVVALLLLAGVGAGIYLMQNDDEKQNNTETSQTGQEQESNNGEAPTLANFANSDKPFVATIKGETDGNSFNTVIEYDGQGNGYFTTEYEGETTEFYFTGDSYITCRDGQCFKTPKTSESSVNVDDYSYSQEDFDKFKNDATYEGRQSCPAGTCDVWLVSTTDQTTRIFINPETNLISQVVGDIDGNSVTVTYEFKDVTITLPENITEIPINL